MWNARRLHNGLSKSDEKQMLQNSSYPTCFTAGCAGHPRHEKKPTRVADRGAAEHVFPRLQSLLTLNPEPNSIRNPSPLLRNNATLEIIDGVMVIPRIVLIMGK